MYLEITGKQLVRLRRDYHKYNFCWKSCENNHFLALQFWNYALFCFSEILMISETVLVGIEKEDEKLTRCFLVALDQIENNVFDCTNRNHWLNLLHPTKLKMKKFPVYLEVSFPCMLQWIPQRPNYLSGYEMGKVLIRMRIGNEQL